MKRRYLLLAGSALGAVGLSRYLFRADMTTFNESTKGTFEVTKTEKEWREVLTSEQFWVLRQHGTEQAGSSPLDKEYDAGTYLCAGCNLPLFTSAAKFNSGTGWPSFSSTINGAVDTMVDRSLFIPRVEVHCHRCGGHLGHVFKDGPAPTGERYCMNGVSLKFLSV